MRIMRLLAILLFSILLAPSLSSAFAQQRPWYLEAAIGTGLTPTTLSQVGHNFDYLCYPGRKECPPHEGFRWRYDLPSDRGWAFSPALGYAHGRLRFEVSALFGTRNLESRFRDITYLDGTMRAGGDPGSNVVETVKTGIGTFKINSLRLNAFYELLASALRVRPYVGAGVGVSRLIVTNSFFETQFSCDPASKCSGTISDYNSLQDVDFTDTGLSLFGYLGVEFPLSDRYTVGTQLVISQSSKLYSETKYNQHPLSDLTVHTEISDIMLASVMGTLRYSFGRVR